MNSLEEIEQDLQKFGQKLRQQGIPCDALYLFGSAARGEMHEWSDIDVGVVGNTFDTDRLQETVTLRRLSYDINPAISPIPLRPEDLQDRFSPISQAIKNDGRQIKF